MRDALAPLKQLYELGTPQRGPGSLPGGSVRERAPRLHPGQGAAVTRVEPDDLVRLEGEGGREARASA
jgi:hypothetical protein